MRSLPSWIEGRKAWGGLIASLFLLMLLPSQARYSSALAFDAPQQAASSSTYVHVDSNLPLQTFSANSNFNDINTAFGSRFDFVIAPGEHSVSSGTDGVFHDNLASYIVGVAPAGQHRTSIFHMGALNSSQGDTYVINESWRQGLDTTSWQGDASDGSGLHLSVDFIDSFLGEPGCTAISACSSSVQADTLPALIVQVSLQNRGSSTLSGRFLFGSNRKLAASNGCAKYMTPGGTSVNILSYDSSADATGGTLFLAGKQPDWSCNTSVSDRVGLAWNYSLGASKSTSTYLILGGWNPSFNLFANKQLPAGCQQESLFAAQEWSSLDAVVGYAIDNLSNGENLLGRAQAMENMLLNNSVLTPMQRWVIANSFRSYKANSWLLGRQSCAGGGYDAAVYEGSYGFLTTVDVMYDYGYFEINRIPWFFKSAMSTVFKNATSDAYGTYFQHDQGGDVTSSGACTGPGKGIPTLRSTCYTPPYAATGAPMPTEEDANVALLNAYYAKLTGDTSLIASNINLIDAAMFHNSKVGDPNTGIAYNFQDTNTTFDDQSDCLHNDTAGAGNLYYQGLKEAAAYRAAAYLDSLVSGNGNAINWEHDAEKIENAMVQEYSSHGFIPLAENTNAYDNCGGRSIVLGEGLFYLYFSGLINTVSPTLLHDLAAQYPADLSADTLASPSMIVLESARAYKYPCPSGGCPRYEWFSKVMLSSVVADLVYTKYGCSACSRVDVISAPYNHNFDFLFNYGDGFRDDGTDWSGHLYPRGVISWAFLDAGY